MFLFCRFCPACIDTRDHRNSNRRRLLFLIPYNIYYEEEEDEFGSEYGSEYEEGLSTIGNPIALDSELYESYFGSGNSVPSSPRGANRDATVLEASIIDSRGGTIPRIT